MKRALITGITGQDGAYLSQVLLNKGYEVHGLLRRSSSCNTSRLANFIDNINLHYGDMTDSTNLIRLISQIEPDEIYNLAAQSHVGVSFETPEYTAQADALGTLRILEAIRILNFCSKTKFYQASTSELFGGVSSIAQNENTPFVPRSPYAAAKLYAYWITVNYRQAYNIFACNGILFNHESPLRGHQFVTRKITSAVANIFYGLQESLFLGNLDARRDWGYAPEYVDAMHLMMQHSVAEDFVIATGKNYTVREFATLAFSYINIELEWVGSGLSEKGINKKTGKNLVSIDPKFFRPTEVDILIGDASKAKNLLGWEPKIGLESIVERMVKSDLEIAALPHSTFAKAVPRKPVSIQV